MNKIGEITYKKIQRISPSQFFSMKNCAYKSVLSLAFDKKPLLPVSANAYMGTVLHKILELIIKRIIINEADLNEYFNKEVLLMEDTLRQEGFHSLIPLQKNVKNFGVKKVLLKKHLKKESNSEDKSNIDSQYKFYSEKWVASKDSLIGGKIDLVVDSDLYLEIIDFKTGAITNEYLDDEGDLFTEIKKEYKQQLKLYGYLYFESTDRFPDKLSLVDLGKQKYEVEFTQQECSDLYNEAKELLNKTNESISSGIFSANISIENCKYCLYRPACNYYIEEIKSTNEFNDISGVIDNAIHYKNGNVTLFMDVDASKISIIGFDNKDIEYFNNNKGQRINIFNIRKEASELVYSTTKNTVIYE
jgi:CRISPR/Cas system-associated exonuclease Cas4 (RecB family)